jgi:hypothetical protein
MTAIRKIIAALIIAFLGLPLLFGVIWVVGLTRATLSPAFISELPREIIEDVPDMAEEIFYDAQDKEVMKDANTRAWFQAAAKAGVTPRQVMSETGLLDWMENELSDSLEQVGEILRGEIRPRPITVDLRPLKNIFLEEKIEQYMMRILENLPPCDEGEEEEWLLLSRRGLRDHELPACRPNLKIAREAITEWRMDVVDEMDNEIEIFGDVHFFPFDISSSISLFSYFLFFVPAFFIIIGALIAAGSPASFFRWSGISTFLGAFPVLLLSFLIKHASLWGLGLFPYYHSDSWSSELEGLILEKTNWIPMRIVDQLFSPVVSAAAIVCVVGIVLFALSLIVRGGSRRRTAAMVRTAPPAPESKEPAAGSDQVSKAGAAGEKTEETESQKEKPPAENPPEPGPEEIEKIRTETKKEESETQE